jgi:hypothetical protein
MKKASVLLAAALLAMSTGIASAAQTHRFTNGSGELSSTNPQAGGGPAGYAAPHEVPENGGAASLVLPGDTPN